MKLRGTRAAMAAALVIGVIALSSVQVRADGTETLGPPSITIASGSGFVTAGTGLEPGPGGTVMLDVPAGATITQVLVYWMGEYHVDDDDSLTVNGTEVTGTLVGGPAFFYFFGGEVYAASYRADITSLNLVTTGVNTLVVEDLDFDLFTNGAGIMVIYDDGTTSAELPLVDGLDLAFFDFPEPRQNTVPQTFTFAPAAADREAELAVFAGSVGPDRPNSITVTVGGVTTEFANPLASADGNAWDSLTIPVEIPAGADQLTVQVFSTSSQDPLGASVSWISSALAVPTDASTPDCVECDGGVTSLTLQYNGTRNDTYVWVYGSSRYHRPRRLFQGTVNPGETFTIAADDLNSALPDSIWVLASRHHLAYFRTDCHWPIGPGTTSSAFEVTEAVNVGGDPICPQETPDDLCDDGRPQVLTFKYNGEGCGRHSCRDRNKCWGDPHAADPVYIVVTDRLSHHQHAGDVYFEGWVNLNGTFDVDATVVGDTHLGRRIWVYVFENDPATRCDLLQKMSIKTSCHRPIPEGLTIGSLELVGYVPE